MNPSGNYNPANSAAYSSNQGGNVAVKTEPQDRYLPPNGSAANPAQAGHGYPPYNPAMTHLQMQQGMGMNGVPNFPPIPGLNMNNYGANRGIAGYGTPPTSGNAATGSSANILMLPRHAVPYSAATAGNGSGPSQVPQVDGAWDLGGDEESIRRKRREMMIKRYPWMANAQMKSLDSLVALDKIPQVDGPTPTATPSVPPLNILPPLNLPSSSSGGISRAGGPPPLTLPPLNLPPDLASSGNRALHPSLVHKKSSEDVKKEDLDIKRPPSVAPISGTSSFARNPNVPAQPSEDITSDLDDSDEEEGPHQQPGSDPDADVTYCTYDKVGFYAFLCNRSLLTSDTGDPRQVKMEGCIQRWHGPCEWERLPVWKMYWVRLPCRFSPP
jgi:hypothetical protein